MTPTRSLLAALALTLVAATPAHAHNAWLLPSSTVLSKAAYVTIDAAVSNDFFTYNHAPLRFDDRLSVTAPDGSALQAENLLVGKLRTVFDLNLSQPGSYRVAVLNTGIMASWKENGEPKRWRGDAERFAREVPAQAEELRVTESAGRMETFVTVGKPSALKPSGKGLELELITHPNDLVAGEAAHFRLLIDGKPAAGLEVTVVRGGSRHRNQLEEIKTRSDADGKLTLTFPQAGYYWLDADTQDDKTTVKAAKERRLSYSATLEVQLP